MWFYRNNTDYQQQISFKSKAALEKFLNTYHRAHSSWGNAYSEYIYRQDRLNTDEREIYVCHETARGTHRVIPQACA